MTNVAAENIPALPRRCPRCTCGVPTQKSDYTDHDDRMNHSVVTKDSSTQLAQHMANHAEGRQNDDVHFRMTEVPEQMLEQYAVTSVRRDQHTHVELAIKSNNVIPAPNTGNEPINRIEVIPIAQTIRNRMLNRDTEHKKLSQ